MKHALRWELVGAAVGAGMASGREAASFFGRYGRWGFAAIPLACAVMAALAPADFPPAWQKRWPDRLRRLLQALLLMATGGAMLCAAGETASLALPGAYPYAMAATLALALLLARKTRKGLALLSRVLLAVLALLVVTGLLMPPMRAAPVAPTTRNGLFLRSLAYGGFNAALMAPVLALTEQTPTQKRCETRYACGGIALFLVAAQLLLMRHPALLWEPLPFVRLTARFGGPAHLLSAASLYLASLSTLTACFRCLRTRLILPGILLCALLGFTGAVDVLYPLLGGGCFLLLAAAKFTNCWRKTFHSRRNML